MKKKTQNQVDEAILAEDFEIVDRDNTKLVHAYGQEFPYSHPVAIHNAIYRNAPTAEERYRSLIRLHHLYWPEQIKTWNYWEEERFFAHCENWTFISLAAGASAGKSNTVAKICLLSYFSNPEFNAAIVASTTLSALQKRVFGYIVALLHEISIPLNFHYTKNPTPQILFNKKDEIHSISALAAGVGTDESNIKNYIGRHPKKKFLLLLDEAPDLSPVVLKSVANLEAGEEGKLQVWVIGNSLSKSDLHGALSTPQGGNWNDVSWKTDMKWRTTQTNGCCLYFSPYRSPAIHEKDPVKKALLEKFLITARQIEERKLKYGENSIEFLRMTLGFWSESVGAETTFTTKPFLENFNTKRRSLWSGIQPIKMVGGLDPAFSTGGDKCILRLALLGHTDSGQMVLDYRDDTFLFKLRMEPHHKDPIDIQLADQIIDILTHHKCLLEDVAFDATGQGRTFPELVRLRAVNRGIHWNTAMKIYCSRSSAQKNNQTDIIVRTPTELWENLKAFIQTNQIAGIDEASIYQMTTRLMVFNDKTIKRELEKKQDYRNRMNAINPGKGTSPDEADAASLCLFAAIHRHGFHLEQTKALGDRLDFFSEKYAALHKAEAKQQQAVILAPLKATYGGSIGVKLKGPY